MNQDPHLGQTSAVMRPWPGTQGSGQSPRAASSAYTYVDEEGAIVRIRADPEQADHSSTVLQDLVQRELPC